MPRILYIHGFNSSPLSHKAKLLQAALVERGCGADYQCPQLSHWPDEAIRTLSADIERCQGDVALVGSSLGGYYATWLAEKYALRAVLVNPAVRPYLLLAAVRGAQRNYYTEQDYELTQEHLQQLHGLELERITRPERYLLMVETGDEILDYRRAVERYALARQIIIDGGDHGFRNFPDHIDRILEFAETGL
ncbi:MAG: YqiA/YcfP family alpha/beta fold hydrolase [Burkholderiales bacterium]